MNPKNKDVYGPNYQKEKRRAIARSSGKCQLCGLRKAEEGHHWAWPTYPSDNEVQGHDITALCKPCHEFATVLRDWTQRKGANFDALARDLERANSFFEKREIFSYWLFPEDEQQSSVTAYGVTQQRHAPHHPKSRTHVPPKKRPEQGKQKDSNCLGLFVLLLVFGGLFILFYALAHAGP